MRAFAFAFLVLLIQISTPSSITLFGLDGEYVEEWNFAVTDNVTVELIIGVSDMPFESYLRLMDLIEDYGGKVLNSVSFGGKTEAIVVDLPSGSISSFVEEAIDVSRPIYVEPNVKFKIDFVPNDLSWNLQWGPVKIEADYAWNTTIGNSSILVAVIDTGVDWDHPDLAGNYVNLGYDWVNGDSDPMDDHGHGTHVAGIVAAAIDNNLGIAGIAQVKVMAEKGLNQSGYGYADDLANAISHAVDQGADILTMSWGDYSNSWLIQSAVESAYESGALLIAAAGNDDTSQEMYPAAYDEVVAVTATDIYDQRPSWSNFGDWVELAAPGASIFSTIWNNDYDYMSGTSMATPHVTGVAALIWSAFPELTRDQVRSRLRETADDLGDSGFDIYYGYGRINARRAVQIENVTHDIAINSILQWKTVVGQGFSIRIDVNLTNQGDVTESFNATVSANNTSVQRVPLTLAAGNFTVVTFTWNTTGFAKGNYTISAVTDTILGETETSDNNVTDGWIIVAMIGDIAGLQSYSPPDGRVDITDIAVVAIIFGSSSADPNWNPNADINDDDEIDMEDIATAAINYGRIEE